MTRRGPDVPISYRGLPNGPPTLIRAGAYRLLGITPSWDAVADRLSRYTLRDVIAVLGRIDAALHGFAAWELEPQLRLMMGLFRDRARGEALARRVALMLDRHRHPDGSFTGVALVDPLVVANVVKVACVTLPPSTEARRDAFDGLAEALLIMSDLITPHAPGPRDAARATMSPAYSGMLSRSLRTHEPLVHLLARTEELFIAPHSDLAQHPDHLDLREILRTATGVAPDALALLMIGFIGELLQLKPETINERNAGFLVQSLTQPPTELTPEVAERLLSLVATDLGTYRDAVAAAYGPDNLRPYHLLPLQRYPLVRIGDAVCCPVVELLVDRLTDGFYHLSLEAVGTCAASCVPGRPLSPHKARARFQRFIGAVFESYVANMLERTAAATSSGASGARQRRERRVTATARIAHGGALEAAVRPPSGDQLPVCDAVVQIGDAMLLVESKARLLSLAVKSGESERDFFAKLDDVVLGAARQLDATLGHLKAGRLAPLGFEDRGIREVFPVVVTLDDLPVEPAVYAHVRDGLRAGGWLQDGRVRPLEILRVYELEWLEGVASGGLSVFELLRRKQRDAWAADQALLTFALDQRLPKLGGPSNPHLHRRFEDLAVRARRVFMGGGGDE